MLVVLFKLISAGRGPSVWIIDRKKVRSEAEGERWASARAELIRRASKPLPKPAGCRVAVELVGHVITRVPDLTDEELRGVARSWWERYACA